MFFFKSVNTFQVLIVLNFNIVYALLYSFWCVVTLIQREISNKRQKHFSHSLSTVLAIYSEGLRVAVIESNPESLLMIAMIHRESTGKVLFMRGPYSSSQSSAASIPHPASKQGFKSSQRDSISSYLPLYRSSRVRGSTGKVEMNDGGGCIAPTREHSGRAKLAEY